ncbi:hypothetical protein ALC60_05669 [Trachymyrmex zeteki]|uniref:Uncharacterized protein n=1 Tax=Mycetomoellerius zeteki TaxID=64791 RepID=A0A151X4T7_9HYME|nr:hypothetical protein ALC60_05669 [Trachymyrmex zeteki]
MGKKYYIVEFEDGIQIIPENWFTCDKKSAVYWPNLKTQKEYDKAVEKMKDLKNDSITVDIKKIFGSTDNFANAKKKLKLAEKLSDLNSDEDVEVNKKRRRLNAAKNFSSSSEEEIDKSVRNKKIEKYPEIPQQLKQQNKISISRHIINDIENCHSEKEQIQYSQVKNNKDLLAIEQARGK